MRDLRELLRAALVKNCPRVGLRMDIQQRELLLDYITPGLRKALEPEQEDYTEERRQRVQERGLSTKNYVTLLHMAQGLTVGESAALLGVPPLTLKSRRSRVYEILGVDNAVKATITAHRLGLLDVGELPSVELSDNRKGDSDGS